MCGIFALLNNNKVSDNNSDSDNPESDNPESDNPESDNPESNSAEAAFVAAQFNNASHRGPDNSTITTKNNNFIGFHRLAINGIDEISNQPFLINNIHLICNGEIYNYKKLYNNIVDNPTTNSDCEVIIYLYMAYGIEYTLNLLDGVFAFVLIDYNIDKIFVARDPYGVRPLFMLYNVNNLTIESYSNNDDNLIGFASEMKQLIGFTTRTGKSSVYKIYQFKPGTYKVFELSDMCWHQTEAQPYNTFNLNKIIDRDEEISLNNILEIIHDTFCEAVRKRVEATDRPIACLLSGGLDSSIVTALVHKYYAAQLETYSIGLENSEDLKYAREVALFLGTKHTEIVVTEDDFFNYIPNIIKNIESYDTTTVRASVGNYLVGKYIAENSDAKVIFNGDGSDELMGGYLYMQSAPDHLEFDKECKRLLKDIYAFDVLRSDRCISTNGLEPRTPFLDREFVNLFLSLGSNLRFDTNKLQEKYLFRKAFDHEYIPDSILWRRKEAFSDGVSSKERSWYKIIEEKVALQTTLKYDLEVEYAHNPPQTLEQLYYRTIFEKHYPGQAETIPYFWMPKYTDATDASARTLDVYNKGDPYEPQTTL